MAFDLKSLIPGSNAQVGRPAFDGAGEAGVSALPPLVPRSQTGQRLKIGLSSLGAIVLLVAIVGMVKERVDETDETVIADAGETEVVDPEAGQSDPLADAGLVPDIPAEPEPEATAPAGPATSPSPANNAPEE